MIVIQHELPAIHPGEYLREILTKLNISQAEFTCAIGVSAVRISPIVKGTCPVTAELSSDTPWINRRNIGLICKPLMI